MALLLGLAIAVLPQSQLILILIAVVALAGLALIFAEPTFGLALTLIAGPFEPYESIMLHLPISAGQALLVITLGAWIARMIYQRRGGHPNRDAFLAADRLHWGRRAVVLCGQLV